MPADISFLSHGDRCAAWHLTAGSDALTGPHGRPCVVMAHGFGATRDCGLLPFAERFAAAGCDVLLFDYRGYADSEGRPRQDVNHWRHRQDYHAAHDAVQRHREAARIADPEVEVGRAAASGQHLLTGAVLLVDQARVPGRADTQQSPACPYATKPTCREPSRPRTPC